MPSNLSRFASVASDSRSGSIGFQPVPPGICSRSLLPRSTQGDGKFSEGGAGPHQASFHAMADEPSALPAIASNQRPERNIIAGSAGDPPAWLMAPAAEQTHIVAGRF